MGPAKSTKVLGGSCCHSSPTIQSSGTAFGPSSALGFEGMTDVRCSQSCSDVAFEITPLDFPPPPPPSPLPEPMMM